MRRELFQRGLPGADSGATMADVRNVLEEAAYAAIARLGWCYVRDEEEGELVCLMCDTTDDGGRTLFSIDVNLDESRSESSSSQPSNSLATGGALGGSSSEPSPEDVLYEHHELYGTGAKGLGAGVMKRAWQPEEDAELNFKLIDRLEELDDVAHIEHNMQMP